MRHFKEILSKAENSQQIKMLPNKEQIGEWMEDYEVNPKVRYLSDFFRKPLRDYKKTLPKIKEI